MEYLCVGVIFLIALCAGVLGFGAMFLSRSAKSKTGSGDDPESEK